MGLKKKTAEMQADFENSLLIVVSVVGVSICDCSLWDNVHLTFVDRRE